MTDYTLTADTAERLLKALAWVERQQQQGPTGTVELNNEVPNHQFVQPDGDSETDGGLTYWSATVNVWDSEAAEWIACDTCWAMSPSGMDLVEDVYYPARQSGNVDPTDDDERPLFLTTESCGGCDDPGTPPGGWTESSSVCYFDIIETRCNSGTTEYRRVRIFNLCGRFRSWTGAWGTSNPPSEPS